MLGRRASNWWAFIRVPMLLPKPRHSSQAAVAVTVYRQGSSKITEVHRGSHQNPHFNLARKAQSYQYGPLDPEKNEIRLLRLRYSPDEAIHCELFHTSIDNAPPYHALSYAWFVLFGRYLAISSLARGYTYIP